MVLVVHICKLSYNLEEDNKQAKAKVKIKIVFVYEWLSTFQVCIHLYDMKEMQLFENENLFVLYLGKFVE